MQPWLTGQLVCFKARGWHEPRPDLHSENLLSTGKSFLRVQEVSLFSRLRTDTFQKLILLFWLKYFWSDSLVICDQSNGSLNYDSTKYIQQLKVYSVGLNFRAFLLRIGGNWIINIHSTDFKNMGFSMQHPGISRTQHQTQLSLLCDRQSRVKFMTSVQLYFVG